MGNRDTHPAAAALKERAKTAITETWRSKANLSLFLALVVFVSFVLPLLSIVGADLELYSDVANGERLEHGSRQPVGARCQHLIARSR